MQKAIWAAVAVVLILCPRAEAAIYSFTGTSVIRADMFAPTADQIGFTLNVSDAAITRGNFDFHYNNVALLALTSGNVADFIGLTIPYRQITVGSGQFGLYQIDIDLLFTDNGNVTTGRIAYSDDAYAIDVAGIGNSYNGTVIAGTFGPTNVVSGVVARDVAFNVPEPATLGLFCAAFGIVVYRRRRIERRSTGERIALGLR